MSQPKPKLIPEAVLAEYGTFRIGGACRRLWDCRTPDEVITAQRTLATRGDDFVLIGGGSNLLFSDAGYPGDIIRFAESSHAPEPVGATVLRVSGGLSLDALAAWCAAHGWSGVNYCSGIPGTVGGAVVGNAGAWGRQIGDVVRRVRLLDPDGQVQWVDAATLEFAYRDSRLKQGGGTVLEVDLEVQPADREDLEEERAGHLALRREKHPQLDRDPCIGSFFRNLEPSSAAGRRRAAGHLLEQAGAKSMREGGARVFERHANIIVAESGCRADDVAALHRRMRAAVEQSCGTRLEREVRFLGPIEGEARAPGFH